MRGLLATMRTKRSESHGINRRSCGVAVGAVALLVANCTKADDQFGAHFEWVRVTHEKTALCATMSIAVAEDNSTDKRLYGAALPAYSAWNWDVFPGGKSYDALIAGLDDRRLVDKIVKDADYASAYEYAKRLHKIGKDELALRYLSLGMHRLGPRAIKIDRDGEIYYSTQSYPSRAMYPPSSCLSKAICGSLMFNETDFHQYCSKFSR